LYELHADKRGAIPYNSSTLARLRLYNSKENESSVTVSRLWMSIKNPLLARGFYFVYIVSLLSTLLGIGDAREEFIDSNHWASLIFLTKCVGRHGRVPIELGICDSSDIDRVKFEEEAFLDLLFITKCLYRRCIYSGFCWKSVHRFLRLELLLQVSFIINPYPFAKNEYLIYPLTYELFEFLILEHDIEVFSFFTILDDDGDVVSLCYHT